MNTCSIDGEISLSGAEIFKKMVNFENGLHKNNCVQFLKTTEEQRQEEPNLRLKFLKKQDECSCSEKFLEKVIGISNRISEMKLVDLYTDANVRNYICDGKYYNDENIVLRLVLHLQDICMEKGFRVLRSALQVTDLSGYKEIFHCFVGFEIGLHKKNCITFLPLSGANEQMRKMPTLRLKLLNIKVDCKCSENFLDKMKDTLDDVQESKLVHILKVYLQKYVRNKNIYDKDIACRLVSHLQDMCISKSLPELARYCFRTYNSTEDLKQILTERFDDLSDKITAVIISEMDSESVSSTISSSDFHKNMKTIMKDRSETLTKIMEKLVQQTDNDVDCDIFVIFERDAKCLTPDQTNFDFYYYTVYHEIAYRGMTM